MDDLPFTQKTDGRDHVRVVHQTQNIVIGGAGFLLCCDAVRTALRLLPRLGSVSLDGGDVYKRQVYRLDWKQVRFHGRLLGDILRVGVPAGLQSNMYAISDVYKRQPL